MTLVVLPVKLELRTLPPHLRTLSALAKHYYHSSSRTRPMRMANPWVASVGANEDLREFFRNDPRDLILVVPEIETVEFA